MLASLLQAHANDSLKSSLVSREMLAAFPVVNRRSLDQGRLALLLEFAGQLVRIQSRGLEQSAEHLSEIC
jgi:hypothetical protein